MLSQVDVVLSLERAGASVMELVVVLLAQWNQILKRTTRTLGAQMVRVRWAYATYATRCRLYCEHVSLAVVIPLEPLGLTCVVDLVN